MPKIEVMDIDLSNKIAAGEVIEKTMNVVKELVENSIDAKSSTIKIDLLDSGVKEIIVTDDGVGMDKEDALLAFSRHATSKLKTLNDLFNIDSLGFRGEALPSIASVSNTILKTSNGKVGTEVEISGGKLVEVRNSDLVKGTKIIVKDLFYNTPVRLKYLKNLYAELANIVEYVNKMALSYPNIKFVLTNNGKQLLNTEGKGSLLKVIGNIYGFDVAKKMISIDSSNEDYVLKGFVSYPEVTKPNRNSIITFVNGRYIKNNELNKAIIEAYHTYVPIDKYPIVVLNIEVDPILVDVNIHPTKMDIKFSKIDTLKELIIISINSKLEKLTLIPEVKVKEEIPTPSFIPSSVDNYEVKEEKIEYSTLEEVSFDFESNINEYDDKNLNEDVLEKESTVRIKKMYPVGIVLATYIICENEDGMYIIDQHAAAERINYEKYYDAMKKPKSGTIDLLVPIKVDLPSDEAILLKKNINILLDMGFSIEEFGLSTFIIRTHPIWLPNYAIEEAIKKIINIIIEKETFDYGKFIEKVAITLACKMSIKANDYVSTSEVEVLLEALRNTKNPFTCPHGRPTIITYSKYELEKLFKRAMN